MSKPTNRRVILKAVASFPLAFSLGVPLSAKANNGNRTQDSPVRPIAKFSENAFPDEWSHVSFEVTRDGEPMPGYLLKLADGNFVAYSSKCKKSGCQFRLHTDAESIRSQFGITVSHPVLACSCHGSVFIPGQVPERLAGPEREAPEQLAIRRCHDKICVLS